MAKNNTDTRLGIVMPTSLARELGRRARAGDRSISSLVRVLLMSAMQADAITASSGGERPACRQRTSGVGSGRRR
jgi:hypothetical protein